MPDLRYLFWLTLMEHGKENSDSDQSIESVAELEVQEVAQKEVALQPNWAARLEGEWSARTSSGFAETIALDPGESLDALKVTVHLTKGRNTRFELDVRNVGAGIAAPLLRYTGPSQLDAQTLLNHAGAGSRAGPGAGRCARARAGSAASR